MNTHVLRAGFVMLTAIMVLALSGCTEEKKKSSSARKGIAVKVKASKF